MPNYPIYGDQEFSYFQNLEFERNRMTGFCFDYYRLDRGKNVDPLYNEPVLPGPDNAPWDFRDDDPLKIFGSMEFGEFENRQPTVRQEGLLIETDALLKFAYKEWRLAVCKLDENNTDIPKEGDVVFVYNRWFDVTNAGGDGFVLNTPSFVGYRLQLKKTSAFTPDRKVP